MKLTSMITTAAMMIATPALAEFKQMPLAGYCTDKFTDFEDTFGEFEVIEFSEPNGKGVSHVYMSSERYDFVGLALPGSIICVVWSNDKGESY